jgi:hypothetical protein
VRLAIAFAVAIALALCASAHADPASVALLPLDAEAKLEIYGQPVASEIARALVAGGIDVVVVGPKMAVPERARLIVDGTIASGKGQAVELDARIRDRATGSVLDTLHVGATSISTLDSAASQLSSQVLPAVQHRLAAMAEQPTPPTKPVEPVPPKVAAPLPIAIVALAASSSPLHDALAGALDDFAKRGHHALQLGTADTKAVAAANAEIGITLDIVSYYAENLVVGNQPSAYARVRLRVANGTKLVFDRVIATDTVLGARDKLADLVAREILWIAEPKLRKVSAWH